MQRVCCRANIPNTNALVINIDIANLITRHEDGVTCDKMVVLSHCALRQIILAITNRVKDKKAAERKSIVLNLVQNCKFRAIFVASGCELYSPSKLN